MSAAGGRGPPRSGEAEAKGTEEPGSMRPHLLLSGSSGLRSWEGNTRGVSVAAGVRAGPQGQPWAEARSPSRVWWHLEVRGVHGPSLNAL